MVSSFFCQFIYNLWSKEGHQATNIGQDILKINFNEYFYTAVYKNYVLLTSLQGVPKNFLFIAFFPLIFMIMQWENSIHAENKPLCETYFSACSTVLQDVFISSALSVIVFLQHLFLIWEVRWPQLLALQNSASLTLYKLIFNFNFFVREITIRFYVFSADLYRDFLMIDFKFVKLTKQSVWKLTPFASTPLWIFNTSP